MDRTPQHLKDRNAYWTLEERASSVDIAGFAGPLSAQTCSTRVAAVKRSVQRAVGVVTDNGEAVVSVTTGDDNLDAAVIVVAPKKQQREKPLMWHERIGYGGAASSAAKSGIFLHESGRRRYMIGAHNVPIRAMEDNSSPSPQVTQLLVAWGNGDQVARDQLMGVVYDELHRLAHRYMKRESPGHTLQTSALVNEAFVRLVDQKNVRWQNRAHFFGIAAQMMRRILVDYARSRNYAKRGGGAAQVSLDEALILSDERSAEVVNVHEALERLAEFDARKSQIVELRFFGGLSIDETAEVLSVSPGTVMRDWTLAKAWLRREISSAASVNLEV